MVTSRSVSVPGTLAESAIHSSCYSMMSDSFGTTSRSLAFYVRLNWRCFLEHLLMVTTAGSPRHSPVFTFLSVLKV